MRKGIVYSLVIMLLSACSGLKNEEKRFKSIEEKAKGIYYLTIEAENGDNTKQPKSTNQLQYKLVFFSHKTNFFNLQVVSYPYLLTTS